MYHWSICYNSNIAMYLWLYMHCFSKGRQRKSCLSIKIKKRTKITIIANMNNCNINNCSCQNFAVLWQKWTKEKYRYRTPHTCNLTWKSYVVFFFRLYLPMKLTHVSISRTKFIFNRTSIPYKILLNFHWNCLYMIKETNGVFCAFY